VTSTPSTADLAALADVCVPTGPGVLFLQLVAGGVLADLAEMGRGLHADCLRMAVEDAFPADEADDFAVFLDLAPWTTEALTTEAALHSVGMRLAAALVAVPSA
jgi:hypothetical protein